MAPRGLSAEDKRIKLLEIFHETKDFFQLKELEKLGPKTKGIVSQSVKEVLQSLVDDNLVQMDKIGSSNCRWLRLSSPSITPSHIFNMQNRLDGAAEAQAASEKQLAELHSAIAAERAARPESDQRSAALSRLASARKMLTELQGELEAYGAYNYLILMSHFTRQHNVDPQDIRTYLGVGTDYEESC
ncbi:Mnd1 family-domain-containing protein [Russula aff. rugulosa BPL654]|nr:Mnd1 family-domain-containing protein [Russula aff. rugulosa BPL654]